MKSTILSLSFLFIAHLLFAQDAKKVLIIGIDGCRPDALEIANTPNLDLLKNQGIFSPHALNDDITISGPGWSAILCGVWSEKHQVYGNNFDGNNYENYPSIFQYVEDFDASLNTMSICHWSPINESIVQNSSDFQINVDSDNKVMEEAVDHIQNEDPDLMFLHFDDVDHAGHSYGFSPDVPEYVSAIENIDALIAPIVVAISLRPNFSTEDWLILVSTDHGGNGFSHGGSTIGEQEVFFMASGKSVTPSLIEKDSMIIIDEIENCLGESNQLDFDGTNDQVSIPSNELFNFGTDQDFTIECRIKTSVTGDVAIVGNKDWDSGVNPGFVFSFKYPSGPEWKINIGDGANRVDIDNGGEIADGEWHTLSASFDRDGMLKMYQDGQFVDEADISNIGNITTNQGLFFGTDINSSYDYDGSIAEIRVWNSVLDAETIEQWYCSTIGESHNNYSDLTGYWKLNEAQGNTAFDESENSNHGTISEASWVSSDSTIVYNYNETPKIVDVAVTALNHLCIELDSSVELDGKNWASPCINTQSINSSIDLKFSIYPNPGSKNVYVHIENPTKHLKVEIIDHKGQTIFIDDWSEELMINASKWASGNYYFYIIDMERSFKSKAQSYIKVD